jgi:hypothetical protein
VTLSAQAQARRHWLQQARLRRQTERRSDRLLAREEVQREICHRVTLGQSLASICTEDKLLPDYGTVLDWLHKDEAFGNAYQRAVRARADVLFEETLSIADDARNDWMARNDPNNPGWIANGEHIQRSRLRVETRKWAASKLNPHRYGEKIDVAGNPDRPVVVSVTHRIVRAVQHETLPPVAESREKAIDGWGDED